eukprot:TRINITY_DN44997_c0_g1_i1.p1 TRINITY_DN44997_c0_g1~~TRINITY_DN44997_c0_g1_i1.p1  ORF type:complete len:289 (+),score=66.73 TRINITY_DN44997_c0_g1_i1:94-960(+)
MIQWVSSFAVGLTARSTCGDLAPFRAANLALGGRPFKISVCIHSVSLGGNGGDSFAKTQRPFVNVGTGDKTKRTELGDWSPETGEWRFLETLTLEVKGTDELVLSVQCAQQVDLVVAALQLSARCLGEAIVVMPSLMQKMRMEDRDIDGMMYVTPSIGFDLILDGAKAGRIFASFETKQAPPPQKAERVDPWCAFGNTGSRRGCGVDGDDDCGRMVTVRHDLGRAASERLGAQPYQHQHEQQQPYQFQQQPPCQYQQQYPQREPPPSRQQQLYGDHRDFLPAPPPLAR